jgi:hypothetical protein
MERLHERAGFSIEAISGRIVFKVDTLICAAGFDGECVTFIRNSDAAVLLSAALAYCRHSIPQRPLKNHYGAEITSTISPFGG